MDSSVQRYGQKTQAMTKKAEDAAQHVADWQLRSSRDRALHDNTLVELYELKIAFVQAQEEVKMNKALLRGEYAKYDSLREELKRADAIRESDLQDRATVRYCAPHSSLGYADLMFIA
jgi:hypothetical protein